MKIGIIAFTDKGTALLQKITDGFDETFYPYEKAEKPAGDWLYDKFYMCDAIVFIGAVGIAVRMIAKLIISKDKDPAVLVIDETGKFVIPLLSGHLGGANALASRLAEALDAMLVITTATDLNGKFAVDVWSKEAGCVIDEISNIKRISASLLKGQEVGFYSDFPVLGALPEGLQFMEEGNLGIYVSCKANRKPFDTTLQVIPRIITLGVGCRKNTAFQQFECFILETLELQGLSPKSLRALASIELKKEEACLLQFAEKYELAFTTFSKEQLNGVQGDFHGSEFVKATTGVDNVCERSAVLQSGGALIIRKTVKNGMTAAMAISDWRCSF